MVIMTLSIGTRNAIYDSSLHSSLENKVKTSSGEGLSDVLLLWSYHGLTIDLMCRFFRCYLGTHCWKSNGLNRNRINAPKIIS